MHTEEEHIIIEKLKSLGIHITKGRLTVFKLFSLHKEALPTSFINKYFYGKLDRISVYRALKLFIQKGILLRIPNTEGETKYIFTQNITNTSVVNKSQRAYFVCSCCEQTKLLEEPAFQEFQIPENIKANRFYFLIEGVCTNCDK